MVRLFEDGGEAGEGVVHDVLGDGFEAPPVAGEPCDRPRGVAHNVINVIDVSGGEFVFVEVELLESR